MNQVTQETTMREIVEEMAGEGAPLTMQTLTFEVEGQRYDFTVILAQGSIATLMQDLVHRVGARLEVDGSAEVGRSEYQVDP